MAPKATPLGKVQKICQQLELQKVPQDSWNKLRDSEGGNVALALNIDAEEIPETALRSLARSIKALTVDDASAFWQWLSETGDEGLSRTKSLLVVLAQICDAKGDASKACAAGEAYLALLGFHGADQIWSSLFLPVIFRRVILLLKCLIGKDKKRAKKQEGEDAVQSQAAPEEEEAPQKEENAPIKETYELLEKLEALLNVRSLANVSDSAALAADQLAAVALKPCDEQVGRHAFACLSNLVDGGMSSGASGRWLASVVLKAVLPGILMTVDRQAPTTPTVPKYMHLARAATLRFIQSCIQRHPCLLDALDVVEEPQEGDEAEEAPAEEKKKPQKRSKKNGAEDDDSDYDPEKEKADKAEKAGDASANKGEGENAEEAPQKQRRERRVRPEERRGKDDPILAFLQRVCLMTPDRAEWRAAAAESVVKVLCDAADEERRQSLPKGKRLFKKSSVLAGESKGDQQADQLEGDVEMAPENDTEAPAEVAAVPERPPLPRIVTRFLSFLKLLLQCERTSARVIAAEVSVLTLERSAQLAGVKAEADPAIVDDVLASLIVRTMDAVPTVRGCALNGVSVALKFLANCGTEGVDRLRPLLLGSPDKPQQVHIASLFKVACTDEKPLVRRAALTFFDSLVPLLTGPLEVSGAQLADFFDIRLLAALSADESVAVRKASVGSLALLTKYVPLRKARAAWVGNVLPLVLDVEATVAEKALEEVEAGVLIPLMELCEGKMDNMSTSPVLLLLKEFDSEAIEYLQRALKSVVKRNEGALPPRLLNVFRKTVEKCLKPLPFEDWPLAVWSLIEEASAIDEKVIEPELALDAWTLVCEQIKVGGKSAEQRTSASETVGTKILCTLEHIAKQVPKNRAMVFAASLRSALISFEAPTAFIRGMMRSLEQMGSMGWQGDRLESLLKEGATTSNAKEGSWKAGVIKSIQTILFEHVGFVQGFGGKELPSDAKLARILFTLGELSLMDSTPISDGLVTAVQTIATNTLYRKSQKIETNDTLRGHAFVALGKMCLRREQLAKKSVELLVLHLSDKESFIVRNNILIVLGDLCIHYTSLVDRFVSIVSDLLRDRNELLRKQASMVLSSLLSEDFIKFRGSIMLRFFYMLSDSSELVRYFVECVFVRILHQRNAAIFQQNFIEVVCAINGWLALPSYQGAMGNQEFSLVAKPNRRAMIYRFMLGLMTNEHKYTIFSQIVTNILQPFVDVEDKVDLPATESDPAGQVLNDSLSLLGCKEMRICFSTKQAEASAGGESSAAPAQGAEEATRGILSNLLKRNLCENIMPVLIQLKDLMERRFSPFLRQLRYCIREILRDFKDDLKDILAGDAQLANEIAHDLENEGKIMRDSTIAANLRPVVGRQSLGRIMNVELTPKNGESTPIMDSEAKRTHRSGMSLPKGRKSTSANDTTPTHAVSPNFGAETPKDLVDTDSENVNLPFSEAGQSPKRSPGGGYDATGASPSPQRSTDADRRRQDLMARAVASEASPRPAVLPKATPKKASTPVRPKDFDFTSEAEPEEAKRPMSEIQASVDAEIIAGALKPTPKTSKAKENKQKRTAGKENGTRKPKRTKSHAEVDPTAMATA